MKIKNSAAKTALKPTEITTAKTSTVAAKIAAPAPLSVAQPAATAPASLAAPARVAAPAPAPVPTPALTTIEVKLDVGFGNAVFLRGQGGGLTWDRGLPLACVDSKTWRWSGEAKDPIKFKLLINDQIWSAGNDLLIAPGQKLEVAPEFV